MSSNTSSMRPFVVKDLVQMVMTRKNMAFDDAVFYVYTSDLYMKLLDDESRMWYFSTTALYNMLETEKRTKRKKVIQNKRMMFRIFCLESYCDVLDMYHEDALILFRQYEVFDFLDETFDILHTQDVTYIVGTIQRYLDRRRKMK